MNLKSLNKSDASLVQAGLKALGFYNGTTRGLPGPKTEEAYRHYLASLKKTGGFPAMLVKVAESQEGVRERGTNGGPSVRKYQSSTWYAPGPWAWCAAFVCWCFQEAQKQNPLAIERPTTPGARAFENWAKKVGAELIKPIGDHKIKPGDILVYTFSHIGIAVRHEQGDVVETIEGNTNTEGSREGDGVYRRRRRRSQVRSIIRL